MTSYLEQLFRLQGKSVFITGAAGQIGRELCAAFINAGATVHAADLTLATLKTGLRKLKQEYPDRIFFYPVDISRKASVDRALTRALRQSRRLDILVNNAGVSTFAPFLKRTEKDFDRVMDINLKGTFFCIQKYARELIRAKQPGVIINIGSIYGVVSPDYRIYTDCSRKNSEVYGATKAGIIQMTKYFAVHLAGHLIRVNCLSPGGVFNPENPQGRDFVKRYSARCPLGRMAETSDLAGGVLYLASDAARYVTGQNLTVDGGFSCW